MAGGMHCRGPYVAGCVCGKVGLHARGACVAGKTAIAVGGMHPTGMHSCFTYVSHPVHRGRNETEPSK